MKETELNRCDKIAGYIDDIIKLNQEGESDYMETRMTKNEYREIAHALKSVANIKRFKKLFDSKTIDDPLQSFSSNQILHWIELCLEPTEHFLGVDKKDD